MSQYTLLDAVMELGGRVVASTQDVPGTPWVSCTTVGDVHALSTSHISPFIEYRAGAGLLKSCKGGETKQSGGGQRGAVKGFSDNARRRLMRLIAGVRLDADLPLFITLTYPNSFPDARSSKKHLDAFFKRFTRAFSSHGSVWKLEPQQRGAPHYHVLTWGCSLLDVQGFVPSAWFDIAGGGDEKHLAWHRGEFQNQHCVQQVYSREGVMRYASKYLGKTFEVDGWQSVGRYWGVIGSGNVPFGELVQQEVSLSDVIQLQRYQRRFSGLKKANRSTTIFCDADQWVEKNGLAKS